MENFLGDILKQVQLIFQGNLNFLHYITFGGCAIALIVGIVQLKSRIVKGILTIIATFFYLLSFCVTANSYATTESILIFFGTAVVLNFIIWAVSNVRIKHCFAWLFGYMLVIIPLFVGGLLMEALPLNGNVVGQFCLMFTAALLSFIVPCIMNMSSSGSGSSGNPFDELGPGWGSVFKN